MTEKEVCDREYEEERRFTWFDVCLSLVIAVCLAVAFVGACALLGEV